jgi:MFS family permease
VRPTPPPSATPTLARGTLIVLAGLYILETAIEASVDTWGVLALRERLAVSALLGAGAFVVGQALAVLARSAFGSLARVAARAAGLAALIAAVGLAVLGTTSSSIAATAGLTAAVMAMAVCGPLLLARLASDAERPAQAIATMQGVGFIGFVAGPTLVGVLADTHGLDRGMVAVAVAALVLAGGSWLTRPPRAATAGPSGRERKRNELADRAGAEH